MRIFLFPAIAAFAAVSCARAAPANDGDWLKREIARAKSGAVIEIPAGDYDLTDLKITRSLTIRGAAGGGVVFRSAETTEKGILVPVSGVDLQVENITFSGARSWDRNGAGIRHEGRNLDIVNCRFVGNEDGVLATGDARGVITVLNSAFVDNGFGDGQSHAIYASSAGRLEISGTDFISTRIGHHVKSLAGETIIHDSLFDDGHGRSSYAIDLSKGGDAVIRNNKFIQASDADNYTIVNYDLTRGGQAVRLVVSGNEITNRFEGGVLLRNDTKLRPVMHDNSIINEGKKPLSLVSPGSPAPVEN